MAVIPLTKGYAARVDDADAVLVAGFEWYALIMNCGVFAARAGDGVLMHRFLLGISDPKILVVTWALLPGPTSLGYLLSFQPFKLAKQRTANILNRDSAPWDIPQAPLCN